MASYFRVCDDARRGTTIIWRSRPYACRIDRRITQGTAEKVGAGASASGQSRHVQSARAVGFRVPPTRGGRLFNGTCPSLFPRRANPRTIKPESFRDARFQEPGSPNEGSSTNSQQPRHPMRRSWREDETHYKSQRHRCEGSTARSHTWLARERLLPLDWRSGQIANVRCRGSAAAARPARVPRGLGGAAVTLEPGRGTSISRLRLSAPYPRAGG